MQLSIFGIIYFSLDLLIIPNYNNKYFNIVMALIITFILISRQLWHSNNSHDFSGIIPDLCWYSQIKHLYFKINVGLNATCKIQLPFWVKLHTPIAGWGHWDGKIKLVLFLLFLKIFLVFWICVLPQNLSVQ